jgi:hypothetical protein
VWAIDFGGFTPVIGGDEGDTCAVVGDTACDIDLP